MQIHIPREIRIPVYTGNNESKGYLFFPKCNYGEKECWENYLYIDNKKYPIADDDFTSVDYDAYCLKYYSKDKKFLRVLDNSVKNGVLIAIEDLNNFGYTSVDWLAFFKSHNKQYYPLLNLNLRIEPSENSRIIIKMIKNEYNLILTGLYQGHWAKVKVQKKINNKTPDMFQYNGWCKIIDDMGYPNIYFSPKD
jgi:hypothetical protein